MNRYIFRYTNIATTRYRSCCINFTQILNNKQFLVNNKNVSLNRNFTLKSTIYNDKNDNIVNDQKLNSDKKDDFKKAKSFNLLTAKKLSDTIMFFVLAFGIYTFYTKYKDTNSLNEDLGVVYVNDLGFKHKMFKTNKGPYLFPEFLLKKLNEYKTFETRKDDVYIVSFPKSGTTWIQEIVYLIINNCDFTKAKLKNIEERMPFLDYPNPGLKQINKMNSPRILKTHLPKSFLPDNIENNSKVIYIVRNPKDVAVSYFHFIKMTTQADYKGGFKDFFKLFIAGDVPYGPWWSHVDDFVTTKNVYVVAYEDLHNKPFETIKLLSKFLEKDISDENINKIIEWCSYKNMKSNDSVNYEWYKEFGMFKKDGNFFRKGEIGDWLNHFSKDMSCIFDKVIEMNLKSKYNFNYGISNDDLAIIYKKYEENLKNSDNDS